MNILLKGLWLGLLLVTLPARADSGSFYYGGNNGYRANQHSDSGYKNNSSKNYDVQEDYRRGNNYPGHHPPQSDSNPNTHEPRKSEDRFSHYYRR